MKASLEARLVYFAQGTHTISMIETVNQQDVILRKDKRLVP